MIYRFNGMRRSGNHAIIAWFIKNAGGTCVWRNNWNCPLSPTVHWYRDGEQCGEIIQPEYEVESTEDEPYRQGTLILRDIYNMAASRMAAARGFIPERRHQLAVDESFAETWLQHAGFENVIRYNDWAVRRSYRQGILRGLGITTPEQSLNEVAWNPGVVSAFSESTDARQLGNVLDRYRQVTLPKWLLNDDDIRTESLRIFGWALNQEGERI